MRLIELLKKYLCHYFNEGTACNKYESLIEKEFLTEIYENTKFMGGKEIEITKLNSKRIEFN